MATAWAYSLSPNKCEGNALQKGTTPSFKVSKYSPLILTFDFIGGYVTSIPEAL